MTMTESYGDNRGTFIELYVRRGLNTRRIAAILGISQKTASRRLHKYGVTPRPKGNSPIRELHDPEWLRREYIDRRKTTIQIAAETGTKPTLVSQWLKRHGIPARPSGQNKGRVFSREIRQRMSYAKKGKLLGADNPNWRGGKVNPNKRLRCSHESKQWSKAVRERDGHKCTECGATGRLHAHHIKPWKEYPALRFDVDNGVSLCPPCHQKVHGFPFPSWAYQDEIPKSAEHQQVKI